MLRKTFLNNRRMSPSDNISNKWAQRQKVLREGDFPSTFDIIPSQKSPVLKGSSGCGW